MTEIESLDDIILVFGGEDRSHSRSKEAIRLYKIKKPKRIISTGNCSGLDSDETLSRYSSADASASKKPESVEIKEYLITNGIPKKIVENDEEVEYILTEEESLDIASNFIKLWPKIDKTGVKKIRVSNDKYVIGRTMEIGRKILGPAYELIPCPTGKERPGLWMKIEKAIIFTQTFDFNFFDLKPGDKEAFENYLDKRHPFHGSKPIGAYALFARIMKFLIKYSKGFTDKVIAKYEVNPETFLSS